MPTPDPEYYTVAEFASKLRVSKMTIYRMVDYGEIPGAIRIGRTIRITKKPADAWLLELAEPETAA